jgi:hypothetical protein
MKINLNPTYLTLENDQFIDVWLFLVNSKKQKQICFI